MTNYTKTNIYRKQMQQLGLNTKQYAKLIDMPYEVVKDVIYDKEGDYSMEIKKLLRNTMLKKHQEIENDYQNAKVKTLEIKTKENDIDYLEWYNNEYTLDLLKKKLHITTTSEFMRKYDLKHENVKMSSWVYQLLCNKREYEGHNIEINKKIEFIKQLYDIIVNNNAEKYVSSKIEIVGISKTSQELCDWYKNFDFAEFRHKHELTNNDIANDLRISYSTMGHLATNNYYCMSLIKRFYDYVMSINNYDSIKNERQEIITWFKTFDFKNYLKKHKLTQYEFANLCDVSYQTINRILNTKDRQHTLTNSIKKIYNYVNNTKNEVLDIQENTSNDEEIEVLDDTDTSLDNSTSDIVDNSTDQIELNNEPIIISSNEKSSIEFLDSNEILRKILITRLTDEEKELIKIFGGKLC